jgi:Concanavalin A-like lectin/glucanases superfamily
VPPNADSTRVGRRTCSSSPWQRALLVVVASLAVWLVAGSPQPVLAIFTKQSTVTGNTASAASSFPTCYPDAVTADSPVGYWRLDETSGTNVTDSAGGRTGTYTNGPTLGQSGGPPDTVNNKAVSFDGTNDYVKVNYAAALNPAVFTYEVWAKPTGGAGTWRGVVTSTYEVSGTNRGVGVWADDTNMWDVAIDYGTGTNLVQAAPVRLNEWVHLALTYDGTTLKIYLNGTLVTSTAKTFSANTSTPLGIGAASYDNGSTWKEYFPGSIDEVAVYNSALTATKVRSHYNTGRCYKDEVLADSPKGYWRLGDASGSTATEKMRADHGTYTNGPTLAATGALTGDSDTAVTFDGTNDYVTVPYDSWLNPSSVTLEGWAKPTGGSGTARTVTASQDTNTGYLLGIGTDNKWRFTVGTGSATTVVASTSTVTINSWAHVVGTYDGTTATLYVNGISVGSSATARTVNSTQPLGIGATDAGGSWAGYFTGSLDEIAVYATALSSARVQAHYLMGRSYRDTVVDSGPASYWRLGESSNANPGADVQGVVSGTYTNSPTVAQAGTLAGDADTAVSFDGSDDKVAFGDVYDFAGTASFSLELWLKPGATNSNQWRTPIGKQDNAYTNSRTGWNVAVAPNNDATWPAKISVDRDQNGTIQSARSTTSLAIGTWYHVVATYDGQTLRIYVNGVEEDNAQSTQSMSNTTGPLNVGNLAGWDDFGGLIDEVAVYNRALSATEVQLHYDSGRR